MQIKDQQSQISEEVDENVNLVYGMIKLSSPRGMTKGVYKLTENLLKYQLVNLINNLYLFIFG